MKQLRDQLDGLAMTVKSDENFATNKEDYLVTVNSLKKRLDHAKKLPDDPPMAGTKTGRTSSKNPNMSQVPKSNRVRVTGMTATPNKTAVPVINRRAAIEHTRKLNESLDNS